MNQERRKQLQQEYKQMRPEMGVFAFRCDEINKIYLGADQSIKSTINKIIFQLNFNTYLTNRTLQADWNEQGESAFKIEVLEILEYDKQPEFSGDGGIQVPPRTDYSADLWALKDAWREKLEVEGFNVPDVNTKFKK